MLLVFRNKTNILFASKTSWRRLQDMSWRRLPRNNFSSSKTFQDVFARLLQKVLKMSSRRLERCKIVTLKTYWRRRLQDMSWRRLLQDVLKTNKCVPGSFTSSHQRCSIKKVSLVISQNSQAGLQLRKRCSGNMQQIYSRAHIPKCNFNKVALQLYWNHSLAWVFSCKFAAYFWNTFF